MKHATILLLLAVVGTALATPALLDIDTVVQKQAEQSTSVITNVRYQIEQLISNLRQAAKDAAAAVAKFNAAMEDQVKQCTQRFLDNIQKLRERVQQTIQSLINRFTSSGGAVRQCIDGRRSEAGAVFNETVANTMACANQRITEVTETIGNLELLGNGASQLADTAMADMKECAEVNTGSLLTTGSCLGKVALATEMKAAKYLTQTGFEIARANVAVATLPAALEICTSNRLVEAGLGTARILMEIGSCSATHIFSIFSTNNA